MSINSYKPMAEDLEENDTLFSTLNHIDSGIILLDQNKNILVFNDWITDHCDLPHEHVIGRYFSDVFSGLRNNQLRNLIKTCLDHEVKSILTPDINLSPLPLYTRDDSGLKLTPMKHVITIKSIRHPTGELNCLLQINEVTSSTDREIQLNEQALHMAEMTAQLRHASDMAEHSNRAKSEFLALMSHELRTPLNAIIGFADILNCELLGPHQIPQYKEYSKDIKDAGCHLLNIINDILDLSKIESGDFNFNEEPVDVVEIIRGVEHLVRNSLAKNGLTYTNHSSDIYFDLKADARSLKQMFLNIISNAIKFTPAGGSIETNLNFDQNNNLIISVKDNGVGISQQDIPLILQPFKQVDSHLTRSSEGTGLGLSLVKKMVEMHDGFLSIESQPNKGTTVSLSFPQDRIILLSH